MENAVYDRGFNGNEWFVIAVTVIGFIAVLLLRKRFSPTQTAFNLMIGVVFGLMFDHTLALPPFDLYDVGDQAQYQVFDIISYAMYSPCGFLFIYFYDRYRIRWFALIPYILLWTALGIFLEWLGQKVGIFHYKHGYKLIYSVPIYLFLQSIHLGMYRLLFKSHKRGRPQVSS